MLTAADAQTFERCMTVGGVAVFPADTVYGLACDPDAKEAVQRIGHLKRRPLTQPSAVLFFDLELALETLSELDERTKAAARALLPGAVSLVVANPAGRYPLACGADPSSLGLRVPDLGGAAAALRAVRWPVLQTSANAHGGPDARRVEDVPAGIREAADLVLDAGELPGTPSTVVDLRGTEPVILREGAVPATEIRARLDGQV